VAGETSLATEDQAEEARRFRADQMPYGGVKGSGSGREGVAGAMDDYTEPRVMVLTGLTLGNTAKAGPEGPAFVM